MSPSDVHPLDVNTVNGSWSVHKGEVSCMEVNSVFRYVIVSRYAHFFFSHLHKLKNSVPQSRKQDRKQQQLRVS
jgi:hypothetical protein